MNIAEMKKNMLEAGTLSAAQIDEICELEEQFREDCEEIAIECEEEGLPSHGSTYELRVADLRSWYDEQEELICE